MPTYEYICTKCGHEFEAFQSISEEPVKTCPQCNGKVERKISGGAGLIFKGSGFYITDYKKSGPKVDTSSSTDKADNKPKSDSKPKSPTDSGPSKNSSADN
jgi:putative FmdB family regulatory protein